MPRGNSTMATLELRSAMPNDLPAIRAIYDYYVANSTCTFDLEPRNENAWQSWLAEHQGPHSAIVAIRGGALVGWGTLSKWNTRCAYAHTVEDSVYVDHRCHAQGFGRVILTRLIELAAEHGHRSVIGQIADHQPASEALHTALGFRRVGCLQRVGFKFDRWIDVSIFQLQLEDARDPGA